MQQADRDQIHQHARTLFERVTGWFVFFLGVINATVVLGVFKITEEGDPPRGGAVLVAIAAAFFMVQTSLGIWAMRKVRHQMKTWRKVLQESEGGTEACPLPDVYLTAATVMEVTLLTNMALLGAVVVWGVWNR